MRGVSGAGSQEPRPRSPPSGFRLQPPPPRPPLQPYLQHGHVCTVVQKIKELGSQQAPDFLDVSQQSQLFEGPIHLQERVHKVCLDQACPLSPRPLRGPGHLPGLLPLFCFVLLVLGIEPMAFSLVTFLVFFIITKFYFLLFPQAF